MSVGLAVVLWACALLVGALAEWYCTRLESERPKGLGGSNPSRSVSARYV